MKIFIKNTFTIVVIVLLAAITISSAAVAFWFKEDSTTLLEIKNEVSSQKDIIAKVSEDKNAPFSLKNDLNCELIVRVIDLKDVDALLFPVFEKATLNFSGLDKNDPSVKFNLPQKNSQVFDDFELFRKENSLILERMADSGESNIITLIKDTGFITFFSTSQKNSIATEAFGYCQSAK